MVRASDNKVLPLAVLYNIPSVAFLKKYMIKQLNGHEENTYHDALEILMFVAN